MLLVLFNQVCQKTALHLCQYAILETSSFQELDCNGNEHSQSSINSREFISLPGSQTVERCHVLQCSIAYSLSFILQTVTLSSGHTGKGAATPTVKQIYGCCTAKVVQFSYPYDPEGDDSQNVINSFLL